MTEILKTGPQTFQQISKQWQVILIKIVASYKDIPDENYNNPT